MEQFSSPIYEDAFNGGYTIGTFANAAQPVMNALFVKVEDGYCISEFYLDEPSGNKPHLLASSPKWTLNIGSRNNPLNKYEPHALPALSGRYDPYRTLTLEEINYLCKDYDNNNGTWREGSSVFDYILDNMDNDQDE